MEEQRRNFGNEKIAGNFRNWNKVMQYYFPDIDEYWSYQIYRRPKQGNPEKKDGPAVGSGNPL